MAKNAALLPHLHTKCAAKYIASLARSVHGTEHDVVGIKYIMYLQYT